MERFRFGLWVGLFAPVDEQSDLVYRRIIDRLSSERAAHVLNDPEIAQKLDAKSRILRLSNGSSCRRQTANPRAKVEGSTYHVIVIDEAQDADTQVVRKSIHPMLAATGGTICKIGTPGFHKGDFYNAIGLNKRRARGNRSNHFEYDYKVVCKYNLAYKKFVEKEKLRLGEDSEEFQMSYCLRWMLDRGMAGRGHAGAQKELKRRYGDKTPDEYWSRTPGQDPVDIAERAIRAWESSPPHKR